jgi:hypothetical protein
MKKKPKTHSPNWGGARPGGGRPKIKEDTKQVRIPLSLLDTVRSLIAGESPHAESLATIKAVQSVMTAWRAKQGTGPRWEHADKLLNELDKALSLDTEPQNDLNTAPRTDSDAD